MRLIVIKNANTLAKKIDALSQKNLNFLTFKDLPSTNKNDTFLVFDFAYKNIFDLLAPLKEKNIKANIIVSSDAVGKYNFYDDPSKTPWQDMLSYEQIKTLQSAGWGVASYGVDYSKKDPQHQEAARRLAVHGITVDKFITPFSPLKKQII